MADQTLTFPSLFAGGTSIGVALEVPQPFASYLRGLRERIEGEAAREIIPPHITLLPPTSLPTYDLTDVVTHLRKAARAVRTFEVLLDGAGTFRPVSPVVYAALALGAQECERLQKLVVTGPLAQELRFAYHPHVTVAQAVPSDHLDAAEQELAGFRARFRVNDFVLYELAPDSRWHAIERFALGSP